MAPARGPFFCFALSDAAGLGPSVHAVHYRTTDVDSIDQRRTNPSPMPPMPDSRSQSSDQTASEGLRVRARDFADGGGAAEAQSLYEQLLALHPDDVEALNYLAVAAGSRGDLRTACRLLGHAAVAHPADAATWRNLGMCALAAGDTAQAVTAFNKAVTLESSHAPSHLQRGHALERHGRPLEAAAAYLRALAEARRTGHWTSDATTPPGLRTLVQHAVAQVRTANRQLLNGLMRPLLERHGPQAMRRIANMAANYVGDLRARPRDPRQRPTFLYCPDLPETPYLDRGLFEWYESLEAAAAGICSEASDLLADGARFEPFLGESAPDTGASYLAGSGDSRPRWDAHFFWRHGSRYEANCAKAPYTAMQLDQLPLGRVPGHGPECLFSILGAGSEIQRHTGVTNTRVVTHLPLIVPPDCALRVAGETHQWEPGRCISFDDTFEHEAWNRSTETRVVLLFDTWNPHLDEAERDAVSQLVTAISDFNNRAWQPVAAADEHPSVVD